MPHTLVVAEKPSVARDIARVLGASGRGEGYLSGADYVVTWAIGHLVTLKEPEEIDPRYKRWKQEDLPIIPDKMPLKVLPKTRPQFKIIKTLMNDPETTDIICATDSGREGELIFRYIYEMTGCHKSVRRLWISSMTDESIKNGFAKLKPSADYDALYKSARCRSEADWLIGMNLSRAYTLRYDVLLPIGRVQTPTLQMLVKRRLEIDAFTATPFCTVDADFGDYKGTWFDPKNEDSKRIETPERAEEIASSVRHQMAHVVSSTSEEKRELAPQLYDLTTLQRDANNMLGFTADKTLKTAQSLYEKYKLITYPRTDSRYLPHDMVAGAGKAMRSLGEPYAAWARPLLESPLPVTKRIFDNEKLTDHHAIIPTGKRTAPETLPPDERKLFDLIARRLIAAFYPPFRYLAARIITGCQSHLFVSTGRTILDDGFKVIYADMQKTPKRKRAGDEDNATLPALAQGDERTVKKAVVLQDKTKPPREHTDSSLLSEMEHAGRRIEDEELRAQMKDCQLGTPATRASIIERLIKVGYAKRKAKQILATEKGVRLIEAVHADIATPQTTGEWENTLEEIAKGKDEGDTFMQGIVSLTQRMTTYAAKEAPPVVFEREEGRKGRRTQPNLGIPCPICGTGKVTENEKAFGCTRWRDGCKFTIWKNAITRYGGPMMTEKLVKALLDAPDKRLRGSTGVLTLTNGQIGFLPGTH